MKPNIKLLLLVAERTPRLILPFEGVPKVMVRTDTNMLQASDLMEKYGNIRQKIGKVLVFT